MSEMATFVLVGLNVITIIAGGAVAVTQIRGMCLKLTETMTHLDVTVHKLDEKLDQHSERIATLEERSAP